MKKEKSFPVVSLTILVVFGLLCFVGGFLSSNILNKRKIGVIQARLSECENKFLMFSRQVIANIESAAKISQNVSSVWHNAVEDRVDFNERMEKFLAENKEPISDLKLKDDMIEIQVTDLKKYSKESKDMFDAVMELYDVYKRLYELGMTPTGTLEDFDSNRLCLVDQYGQVQSKLFAYMPALKKPVEAQTASVDATVQEMKGGRPAPAAKVPVVAALRPLDVSSVRQLSFDERIKKIAKNMTYRQVESQAGVPRDKKKDSRGREVWLYPSEKTGFRNVVYFDSDKVLQTKNLPLNGALD